MKREGGKEFGGGDRGGGGVGERMTHTPPTPPQPGLAEWTKLSGI